MRRLWEISRCGASANGPPASGSLSAWERDRMVCVYVCEYVYVSVSKGGDCPEDVPTVDLHWFANRELQAPGAMSKYQRLPRSVRLGKERE